MIIASLLVALYLNDPIAYQQLKIINYVHQTAQMQGIDPNLFLMLASCESKLHPEAKGDYRSETGEFMAAGLYQFWPSTFVNYSKKYNIKGHRLDPYSSADLAALMIKDGEASQWKNCATTVGLL